MTALNLHHAIFANEKFSDLPLRSAASFLHPAPERDESPTSHLFASSAYQDLIQRQPTHPDGPMSGWDLGLNLLGDPMTASEYRSREDYQTKMKLRYLHAIKMTFELVFGIWGMYTTVRYFLAFSSGTGDAKHVWALVLAIISALVVALVIISLSMPLFPQQSHPDAWRHARWLVRACYLLLLSAGATMNLILVSIWHPSQFCGWDIDISWYTSATNTVASPCHPAPFAVWIAAAVLRLVVTWTVALLFTYTLRAYHGTRHPAFESSPKYTPYFPSDPEDISPVSASSPLHRLKSTFKYSQSDVSVHMHNHSNATLPKYNSMSTLALETPCMGPSRAPSAPSVPPPKDNPPLGISPPTSRSSSGSSTQFRTEMPPQTPPVSAMTAPSSGPCMLRRMHRMSCTQVTSDAAPPSDTPSYRERSDGQTTPRDRAEIRSGRPGPGLRSAGVSQDLLPHASVPPHDDDDDDDARQDTDTDGADDGVVYAYGYGAQGPTYPYLDMYTPQRPGGCADAAASCADVDEHGVLHGHRRAGACPEGEAWEAGEASSGEEEEEEAYVVMMGGFVRRMATIASLGSREGEGAGTGTHSTTGTGSAARRTARSKTPGSPFSSVRFADERSSCASGSPAAPWSRPGSLTTSTTASVSSASAAISITVPSSKRTSLSTTYLSFSSGGTDTGIAVSMGMCVNERGERVPWPDPNGHVHHAGTLSDRHYDTASQSSVPRRDDDDDDDR